MSNNYKIREARIELQPGVTLIVEVDSIDATKKLLKDLSSAKLLEVQAAEPQSRARGTQQREPTTTEDPASRVELRAGLSTGRLGTSNILAFKDDIPQLLRPGSFKTVSDAAISLLFAIEIGLQNTSIDFESFKALYETQNIKSGSPLAMLLTNLRNSGYLDKKAYSADRTLRLTAKGEKKAIEVLKVACEKG